MTVAELLVAAGLGLTVVAATFNVARPLQAIFDTEPERADMHQRLRAGVFALTQDLWMAAPPIMPYRIGARAHDPDAGVFYRDDVITVVAVPWHPGSASGSAGSRTYYLRRDAAAGTSDLMRYDGGASDLPVVSHVVTLRFEYYGAAGNPLPPATLHDGPWFPDARDRARFDVDLLHIRRVGVIFAVRAAPVLMRRALAEREIRFDVSPRNLDVN
jgi:hypothetical protein